MTDAFGITSGVGQQHIEIQHDGSPYILTSKAQFLATALPFKLSNIVSSIISALVLRNPPDHF